MLRFLSFAFLVATKAQSMVTSAARTSYELRAASTCNEFVRSLHECSAAGISLGMNDTSAEDDGQYGNPKAPPYCYLQKSGTSTYHLKFNAKGDNTGSCTSANQCICIQTANSHAVPIQLAESRRTASACIDVCSRTDRPNTGECDAACVGPREAGQEEECTESGHDSCADYCLNVEMHLTGVACKNTNYLYFYLVSVERDGSPDNVYITDPQGIDVMDRLSGWSVDDQWKSDGKNWENYFPTRITNYVAYIFRNSQVGDTQVATFVTHCTRGNGCATSNGAVLTLTLQQGGMVSGTFKDKDGVDRGESIYDTNKADLSSLNVISVRPPSHAVSLPAPPPPPPDASQWFTEYLCKEMPGNDRTITCSTGIILVNRAFFGGADDYRSRCPDGSRCMDYPSYCVGCSKLEDVTVATKTRCDGKSTCVFDEYDDSGPTEIAQPDPCGGKEKYWKVTYMCQAYQYLYIGQVHEQSECDLQCVEQGRQLPCIKSPSENAALTQYVLESGELHGVWLGYTDADVEGSWAWHSGCQSSFKNWRAGEPNGDRSDNCAMLRSADNGIWNDVECSMGHQFTMACVCEASTVAEVDYVAQCDSDASCHMCRITTEPSKYSFPIGSVACTLGKGCMEWWNMEHHRETYKAMREACEKSQKASLTWQLIAKQNVNHMMFNASARSTFKMNENDPASDAYMNIGAEDVGLKVNGKYRFRLVYDSSMTLEWAQTSWLTSSTIQGFECISPVDCGPSSQRQGARFQGLGKSPSSKSVLDGTASSHSSWWNSVGTIVKYENGIPGWNEQIQTSMELFVARQAKSDSTYTFEIAVPHQSQIGLHVTEVEFVGDVAILVPPGPGDYCVGIDGNTDRHGRSFYNLVDGDISTLISCNNPTSVGQVAFKLIAPSTSTNLRITYQRPKYAPGWRILRDGVQILKETSNRGNSETPTPVTYDYTLPEASPVTQYLYVEGQHGNGAVETAVGSASLIPNVTYSVSFEILRNDLGHAHEYVQDVEVDGVSLGACHPDGGDTDCTYFKCPFAATEISSSTGLVSLSITNIGHSWDCDCDKTTWECSKQGTVGGRAHMKIVGKFLFEPVQAVTSRTQEVTSTTQGAVTSTTQGAVTSTTQKAVTSTTQDAVTSTTQEACAGFVCPSNYKLKPVASSTAQRDDFFSCCDQVCSGFVCPSNYMSKMNAAGIVGNDRFACCDEEPSAVESASPNIVMFVVAGFAACTLLSLFATCVACKMLRRPQRRDHNVTFNGSTYASSQNVIVNCTVNQTSNGVNLQTVITPSRWCVSVGQFFSFLDDVERCFTDADPNCFDVSDRLVKPATQASDCCYALMLNPHGIAALYYVVHGWAGCVFGLGAALRDSIGKSRDEGVWISLLSIPQTWNTARLEALFGTDPYLSPFYNALSAASIVLAVRAPTSSIYGRLWCVFELWTSHELGKEILTLGRMPDSIDPTNLGCSGVCTFQRDTDLLRPALSKQQEAIDIFIGQQILTAAGSSTAPSQKKTGASSRSSTFTAATTSSITVMKAMTSQPNFNRYSSLDIRPLPEGKTYHYFMSHKKHHSRLGNISAALALSIHDALDGKGFVGFYDVDNLECIEKDELEDAVKKSCTMLVCFTDETCESEWCRFEWEVARDHNIPTKGIVDLQNFTTKKIVDQIQQTNPFILKYQMAEYTDRGRKQLTLDVTKWLETRLEESLGGKRPSVEKRRAHSGSTEVIEIASGDPASRPGILGKTRISL